MPPFLLGLLAIFANPWMAALLVAIGVIAILVEIKAGASGLGILVSLLSLGTFFIAILCGAAFLWARGALYRRRWMLWILMLAVPFPYIANTAGWITAEVGRQPWLAYGLYRTAEGYSRNVSSGNGLFTLIGFMGMYTVLAILFLFLVRREVDHGPSSGPRPAQAPPAPRTL